jgi:hypothetical protein
VSRPMQMVPHLDPMAVSTKVRSPKSAEIVAPFCSLLRWDHQIGAHFPDNQVTVTQFPCPTVGLTGDGHDGQRIPRQCRLEGRRSTSPVWGVVDDSPLVSVASLQPNLREVSPLAEWPDDVRISVPAT